MAFQIYYLGIMNMKRLNIMELYMKKGQKIFPKGRLIFQPEELFLIPTGQAYRADLKVKFMF